MSILIKLRNCEYPLEGILPLNKALQQLNISSQSVLAIRNGALLTEDELLRDGDQVELIAVISGG